MMAFVVPAGLVMREHIFQLLTWLEVSHTAGLGTH